MYFKGLLLMMPLDLFTAFSVPIQNLNYYTYVYIEKLKMIQLISLIQDNAASEKDSK